MHSARLLKLLKIRTWKIFKENRQNYDHRHSLLLEALNNYNVAYLNIRNYEIASRSACERNLNDRVREASKLFYSYIRKKKKSALTAVQWYDNE